jgi:hypothetical protein
MLEGLDAIDWAELHHAYGPATDVPDLIRSLLSDDPEIVEEALDSLYGTIWHQGTVYQATAYAVPFLIELLDSEAEQAKVGLLGLLGGIGAGASYSDVHVRQEEERLKPEVEAQIARELDWVKAAHEAVRRGLPVYIRLLDHENKDVRMMAAWLLAVFPEDAVPIATALRTTIERETDLPVKAGMVVNLGELLHPAGYGGGQPVAAPADCPEDLRREYSRFFEDLVRHETFPGVRLAAAVSLAKVAPAGVSPEAVDMLADGLVNRENYRCAVITPPVYAILPAMLVLPPEGSVSTLGRALEAVRDSDTAHKIAVTLLTIAFGGEPLQERGAAYNQEGGVRKIEYWGPHWLPKEVPPRREAITELQRQALEDIANCDAFWTIRTNLLDIFGLPDTRDQLRDVIHRQKL